jgi:hypothetical protein
MNVDISRCAAEWLVALLIMSAVVSAWRGAWVILDALLFPDEPVASAAVTLGVGAAGFVACAVAQPALANWSRGDQRTLPAVVDALYSYAGLWVSVATWRGAWYAWDLAQGRGAAAGPPDGGLALDGLVSHVVGLVALLPLRGFRNLNAAPMVISSDVRPPFLGGRTTVGVEVLLSGLLLLRSTGAPPVARAAGTQEWRAAVGLPREHARCENVVVQASTTVDAK